MLKTRRIGLIVTEEEKRWVIQLAKLEGGLTQASLIRRLIYKAAESHTLVSVESNKTSNEEVNHEQPVAESK
jgi:hypothetical protein